jgi:hypothetical protein
MRRSIDSGHISLPRTHADTPTAGPSNPSTQRPAATLEGPSELAPRHPSARHAHGGSQRIRQPLPERACPGALRRAAALASAPSGLAHRAAATPAATAAAGTWPALLQLRGPDSLPRTAAWTRGPISHDSNSCSQTSWLAVAAALLAT